MPEGLSTVHAVSSCHVAEAAESSLLSPCGSLLVDINIPRQAVTHHRPGSGWNPLRPSRSKQVFRLLHSQNAATRCTSRRPEVAWLGMAQHSALLYATCALSDEHVYLVDGSGDQLLQQWSLLGLLCCFHPSRRLHTPADISHQQARAEVNCEVASSDVRASAPGGSCGWSADGHSLAIFTEGRPAIIMRFATSVEPAKRHSVVKMQPII